MRRFPAALAGALLLLGLFVPASHAAPVGDPLDVNGSPSGPAGERQSVAEGGTATLTAAVTNFGAPVAGQNIDFEIEPNDNGDASPNDGGARDNGGTGFVAPVDFTCTTGADGTCSVSYTDDPNNNPAKNIDQIRAWVDTDGIDDTVEASRDEGNNEITSPDPGDPEPNNTDVVQVRWVAPTAAVLNVEPDASAQQSGRDRTLTATVTKNGRPVSGIAVNSQIESPASRAGPGPSCETDANGTCTVKDNQTTTTSTRDTIRFWIEEDGAGLPDEADMGEGRDETKAEGDSKDPDNTDVIAAEFVAELFNLNVESETVSADVGDQVTLSANLTDKDGAPVASQRIGFLVEDGPNKNARTSCITDALGNCSTQVTSKDPGADVWLGWYDQNGDGFAGEADTAEGQNENQQTGSGLEPDRTDVVTVTYEEFCPGHRGDSRNQVVGTNKGEVLVGTNKADVICGLGSGDTLRGKGSNDVLLGGNGNDQLFGGAGPDKLFGQAGNDTLNGGPSKDACKQGSGSGPVVNC